LPFRLRKIEDITISQIITSREEIFHFNPIHGGATFLPIFPIKKEYEKVVDQLRGGLSKRG
jgi:hypothetical protein